jgi:gliding motility-associated-like protein
MAGAMLLLFCSPSLQAQIPYSSLGYAFEKTITVDPAQVTGPADLSDFPMLVNIAGDPDLRTMGNGGNVQSNFGYDISFVDNNGYKLDHEIELYDGSIGRLIAWVRVPALLTASNTTIKILYGNPQISSNPSTPGVWKSEYAGVWHLQGTNDATANGNNGAVIGGATSTAGQIGNAYDLNGAGDYIRIPDSPSLDLTSEFTISAWIRADVIDSWDRIVSKSHTIDNNPWTMYGLLFDDMLHTRQELAQGGTQWGLNGSEVIPTGSWRYVVATYNGSVRDIYVSGVSVGTSNAVSGGIDQNNIPLAIGAGDYGGNPTYFFDGRIDEVRVLNKAKSADWINTEYNNQRLGSTFYSVSGQSQHSIYKFNTICANDIVSYSVPNSGFTYTWSAVGGTIQSGQGTPAVDVKWNSGIGPWNISLQVDDGSNINTATYTVDVNQLPIASIIPDPATTCPGANLGLNGNPSGGSGTYTNHAWSGAGSGSLSATNIVTPTFNNASCGSYNLTYSVTDDNGCIGTDNISVSVSDNTAPTWTTAAGNLDRTVECSDAAALTAAQALTPVATDNCDVTLTPVKISGGFAAGSCPEAGTYTNTWTVTDDCGNVSAIYTQVITVEDNTAPTFTVPANDTICRSLDCSYNIGIAVTGDVTDETDNCSAGLNATFTDDVLNLNSCDTAGYVIRQWTLTDHCGNVTKKDQIIWIEPVAVLSVSPRVDTICSGSPVNIRLTSPTVPTQDVRFRYTTEAPAGVTVTPANASGLINPSTLVNTIINTTNQAELVKFIITPYSRIAGSELEKCTGINDTAYVWVEPTARVMVSPKQDTICNGDAVNILLTSPTVPTRTIKFRYVTQAPAGVTVNPASGGPLDISDVLTNTITNTTDQAKLVKFIVTPYSRIAGSELEKCTGINDTAYVWVEPTARVTVSPRQDTICNGSAVSIRLTSPTVPTRSVKFRYVTEAPAGVTVNPASGGPLDNNDVLANTITNINDQAQLVKFIITPYSRMEGLELEKCTGINDTAYVWVEPTVKISATGDTICNGGITDIPVTSTSTTTNGIRYTWTVTNNPNISGASNSVGNGKAMGSVLDQTLTNNSADAQKVTYTITPWTININGINSCPGTPLNVDVWIEPTVIITASDDSICNGGTVDITVNSINTATNGIRFTWTVTNNPNITGESGSIGNGQAIGSTISQTLINTGTNAEMLTYTITPWTVDEHGNNSCMGVVLPLKIDVWVDPTVTLQAKNDTICNGEMTSIPVTSPNTTTNGIRYTWTVTDNPNITGETGSIGNGQDIGLSIAQALVNSSDSAQKVTYTISPWSRDEFGSNACIGTPINIDVWVEPTARVTVSPKQDTICNGGAVNIGLTSPSVPTRAVRFRYVTQAPAGVTVNPASGGPLDISNVLTNTITNTTDQAKVVKFIITPYSRMAGSELEKCTGINDTAYVWVEPTARVMVSPKRDTICNGDAVNIRLTSPTVPTRGIKFRYVTQAPAGVTVNPASGGPLDNNAVLANTITNSNDQAQLVKFIITPYSRIAGSELEKCTGINDTAYVWVEPTARVSVTPKQDTICSGSAVNIRLTSPTVPTRAVRFRYVTQAPAGVTVTPASASGLINPFSLGNTITNTTDQAQLVKFIITPYSRIAGSELEKCTGINDTAYVWVEPGVKVFGVLEKDTLCSGDAAKIHLSSPSVPTRPVMFRFRTNAPFGVVVNPGTGTALSNGAILTEVLQNNTDTAKQVAFIITPYTRQAGSELEKCTGSDITIRVWVEPTPKVALSPGQDTICTSLRPSVRFTTVTRSLQPVRFYYEAQYNHADVSVFFEQDTFDLKPGFILVDSIVNRTTVAQRVTFIAYPYLMGPGNARKCPGSARQVVIWVAPTLRVVADTVSTFIGGNNIKCFGEKNGFIRLTPVGGITAFPNYDVFDLHYSWDYNGINNWKTTKNIGGLGMGTYVVNINDKLNCRDQKTFVLTQPDKLITNIVIVDTLSCQGSDGVLTSATSGGTLKYLYEWTPPIDYYLPAFVYQDTLYNCIDGLYKLKVYDTNGCTAISGFSSSQPSAVWIGVYPDKFGNYEIKCNGENSGSWTTKNSWGYNITYHWTSSAGFDTTFTNSQVFNYQHNLRAGFYELHYSDYAGCAGYAALTLNEPNKLSLDPGQVVLSSYNGRYNVSCFGREDGSITLNHIQGGHEYAGYNFDWSTISGSLIGDTALRNQAGLGAGKYSVAISDTFNCTTRDTFDLVQPPELRLQSDVSQSISGGYNVNCYGDKTGSIVLTPQGGDITVGPYQYIWQQGGNTNELRNIPAGDYVVTVKDGIQCGITDTISLTQPPVLQIDSTNLSDYHGFEVSCANGNNGTIQIYGSGGTGSYTYNWTENGVPLMRDTSYIDNLTQGIYNLRIGDINQCLVNWAGTIDAPEPLAVNFDISNVNCTGSVLGHTAAQVTGGLESYSYSWNTGKVTPAIVDLDTGVYILTVTDYNACQLTDTAIIKQNSTVQIDIQVVDSISCHGSTDGVLRSLATNGIAPYAYLWNIDSTSETISGAGRGSYDVTVTDADGCTNSQSIILKDPDPLLAVLTINNPTCYQLSDGSVTLSASGGTPEYLFNWNGSAVNSVDIENLKAGTNTLHITDQRNCQVDTSITISQPEKLEIAFNSQYTKQPFCPDWQNGSLAITVTGGTPQYQYQWAGYPSESDSILHDVKEDIYAVRVIDMQGCQVDSSFKLKALNNNCLEIPSAFTPNYDFANDNWDISYMNENGGEAKFHEIYPNGEIQVYDRLGNLVYHCKQGCFEAWNGEDMNGRRLPVDSYFFIIELNNGSDIPPIKGIVTIIK